jgi:hypothetical protein
MGLSFAQKISMATETVKHADGLTLADVGALYELAHACVDTAADEDLRRHVTAALWIVRRRNAAMIALEALRQAIADELKHDAHADTSRPPAPSER